MSKFLGFVFLSLSILFLWYLTLPDPQFPSQLPNSIRSNEPGDMETPLRRAYYTDMSREDVINHYKKEFDNLPFLRLNYPPEESQVIIRDQTKSSFLEELVHPFRESIYINGFEPKMDKDAIVVDGKSYRQKIIIKQVNSNIFIRILVYVLLIIVSAFLFKEYAKNNSKN